MTNTTTTPGRRLHAALLAHRRGIDDDWGDLGRVARDQYEAAAREYDGERASEDAEMAERIWERIDASERAVSRAHADQRDRLDALAAEVAALRRAQDADLYAGEEVGNRLSRCEAAVTEVVANVGAIVPHVEDRVNAIHGRVGERLAKLEAVQRMDRQADVMRINDHEARLAALEARAIDGGDPLRRTG